MRDPIDLPAASGLGDDMETKSIYLVQRLKRKTSEYGVGFDALFSLDYMGSSEFENGSVHESLVRMRQTNISIEEVTINFDDRAHTLFLVGGPDDRLYFAERLEAFLKADRYQENPRIIAALRDPNGLDSYLPDAWWDLDCDLMWTTTQALAEDLKKGLVG